MKITEKIAVTTLLIGVMLLADIPILPGIPNLTVELVPEAQAIFGVRRRVRRRTAVVAYSEGAASAASASSASQQQAAAANQEAAAAKQEAAVAQQQLAAAQPASGVPIGTVAEALPAGCIAVTVGNSQYQDCDGSFYRAAFQGNKLVYVVVQRPL
jgi:6-phosphogluconate dehydrogenase (decarboxylating)